MDHKIKIIYDVSLYDPNPDFGHVNIGCLNLLEIFHQGSRSTKCIDEPNNQLLELKGTSFNPIHFFWRESNTPEHYNEKKHEQKSGFLILEDFHYNLVNRVNRK